MKRTTKWDLISHYGIIRHNMCTDAFLSLTWLKRYIIKNNIIKPIFIARKENYQHHKYPKSEGKVLSISIKLRIKV